jgi:hypothetical protein
MFVVVLLLTLALVVADIAGVLTGARKRRDAPRLTSIR